MLPIETRTLVYLYLLCANPCLRGIALSTKDTMQRPLQWEGERILELDTFHCFEMLVTVGGTCAVPILVAYLLYTSSHPRKSRMVR